MDLILETSLFLSIPLINIFNVSSGYSEKMLDIGQVILAGFMLVYTLLLIQEDSSSRAEQMSRDGNELSSFARKLAGFLNDNVENKEYQSLVNKYYNLLERSESHKTIDFMFIRLERRPHKSSDWILFIIFIMNFVLKHIKIMLMLSQL